MKNSSFVHLHTHSSMSLLDGLGKIEKYVQKASEMGFTHLAITDHGNVNGAIKFQSACDKYGIKSLIGSELYIVEDATIKSKENDSGHILVLVKNEQGWKNLLQMLSYANLKGFYFKPRISYDILLQHHEGLIITSACAHSWLFQKNGRKLLCDLLEKKNQEDIYLEIMPHNDHMTIEANEKFIRMSNKFDIPLISTNDNHYVNKEDHEAHEVLLAIQRGAKWHDKNRWKFNVKTLHFQSADEMIESFEKQDSVERKVYLKAMRNTLEVALACENFRIEKKQIRLPKVAGIEDEEKKLRELCARDFVEKVGEFMSADYENRIDYEISVLKSKNAIRYILLVWDLVQWCRENGILMNSRGSIGCSLTSFLCGLTTIDPIKYNLPFSRFLNEERIDLPDADLDFPDNKRHLITERLHELYGESNIAGISTFNRMKARGVIRDVARVFDVPLKKVDAFVKLIDRSIDDAFETEIGKEFASEYSDIVKFAQILENTEKSLGRHAAGKIISDEDLTLGTRAHLCMREDELTVNWEGEDCEHQGLVKLDILGLNTLTVIAETISLVKKNHKKNIDFFKIPLEDPIIYQELSNGRFSGVFQMGWAVRNLINETEIRNIQEWADAIALARPGPLDSGQTAEYVRRKHGGKWDKKHPLYEEVLKDTYGVVLFQESVINVINKVAGLPYSTADKIRKVIGKKRDIKEFEPYRKAFMKGCLQNETLDQDEAEEFWEGLLKHSRYSFGMAHAMSYAILGYKTLWLLHYFPLEFICASLSYGTDKIREEMLAEAQKIHIKIVPPKYGISQAKEWIVKNNKLYAPYMIVKGIGEKLAEEICVKKEVKKTKGFFASGQQIELKPKVLSILETINAFDLENDEISREASIYFDIDFNQFNDHDVSIEEREPFELNEELNSCTLCELHRECKAPVHPSPSKYNLMIIGESPGKDEDQSGQGFIGRAGKLLWQELIKHKLQRRHFHVSNSTKCFPSKSRTPTEKQVDSCAKWLDEEIEHVKPAMILAFGNIAMYRLTGQSKGIMKASGNIVWSNKYNCLIGLCVHPSLVLRNASHADLFSRSIANFAEKLKKLS